MKKFKDLKIGDTFFYCENNIIQKFEILKIRENSCYRKYLTCYPNKQRETTREFIIPHYCLNDTYCHDYGMYIDPKYILEKINNEYENFTLDIE